MGGGKPNPNSLSKLRSQLAALKTNYGSSDARASNVTIDDMNQTFSGAEIDAFVEEITANLDVALRLYADAEQQRYGSIEP